MADTPTAMIFQHAYEQPRPLRDWAPHVPESLEAIVARMMEKDPDKRYEDCGKVLEELQRYRAGEPVQAILARSRSCR